MWIESRELLKLFAFELEFATLLGMRRISILIWLLVLVSQFLLAGHKNKTPLLAKAKEVEPKRSFVVVVASWNNAKYYEKNLRSIFEQDYPHYRVIYIDDASTDETAKQVTQWLDLHGNKERVELICNAKNQGPLANFYRGIHLCKDEEIVVFLDGDDWFAHDRVLTFLNRAYEDPDIWMTYGNYLCYPSYLKGNSKAIPDKVHKDHSYRKASEKIFTLSHLKTGYAGLFKKINLADLTKDEKFFSAAGDQAIMLPAIEMAKTHARFIRDVLYIYNRDNPTNEDKTDLGRQQLYRRHVLSLPQYQPISSWRDSSGESVDEIPKRLKN